MVDQVISDSPIHRISGSVPFPRSYWVVPGKLLAGCYPGSEHEKDAQRKLKGLIDHGIRHVINLMELRERNWQSKPFRPYEGQMKSIAESRGMQVTFERTPMLDGWVPSHAEMLAILDSIDGHIEEEKPTYVHCWGGRGRTGTVVGCYLMRHGLSGAEEVLERIRRLRRNTLDRDQPSPESERQVEMILSWVKGE